VRLDGGVVNMPWFPEQLRHRYPALRSTRRPRAGAGPTVDDWLPLSAAAFAKPGLRHDPSAVPPPGLRLGSIRQALR
jgi:hypothetical protein